MGSFAFVAHYHRLLAGDADFNLNLINFGLGRRTMWRLKHNSTMRHAPEVLGEFGNFLTYLGLDRSTPLNIVEMDLDLDRHARRPLLLHGLRHCMMKSRGYGPVMRQDACKGDKSEVVASSAVPSRSGSKSSELC